MNSRVAGIIYIAALLGLSGCATMSADECAMSDWRTIGFEDGSMGYTAERLGNHRKACAKHGVAPDFEAYQTGCQGNRIFFHLWYSAPRLQQRLQPVTLFILIDQSQGAAFKVNHPFDFVDYSP